MIRLAAREAGFSLLEVLIAMLILSIGSASLLALFAAGASTHRKSIDRTHAALLAERVFSEVRAAYTVGMEAEAVLEALAGRIPEDIDGYRHEIFLAHPLNPDWAEDELFARVTVRWRESGQDRAEAFQTVVLPRFRPGRSGGH